MDNMLTVYVAYLSVISRDAKSCIYLSQTIQVALSQMATPRAFTDHTSPAPSDDEDQSTYVKPTRRQTSKCVVTRKRGRPRKASARSAPFRKRPVKVESVTSDTNTSMPVRGRKAAARARKRLARIVHVTSDGDGT